MYYNKIIIILYNNYNIFINISIIERILKKIKISHKKILISRLLFLEI